MSLWIRPGFRAPTAEEVSHDRAKRRAALERAIEEGSVSEREAERRWLELETFQGYPRELERDVQGNFLAQNDEERCTVCMGPAGDDSRRCERLAVPLHRTHLVGGEYFIPINVDELNAEIEEGIKLGTVPGVSIYVEETGHVAPVPEPPISSTEEPG